jgi:hypothetical protein
MEKGILKNRETDFLIAGKAEFNKQSNKIVISNPNLIIGSDRNDFYDFLGNRRETLSKQNRNWMKFAIAITAAHFLLVRVPTLFSHYFGDSVSKVSQKMGATDESVAALRLQRMKQRKEL